MPQSKPKPSEPPRLRLRYLQPLCLALLARKPGSGYDVLAALSDWPPFADAQPDAPGVYRTLQGFAKRGLLRGRRHPPTKGPARLEYALTPAGFAALANWHNTLLCAQKELSAVLDLVRSAQPPVTKPAKKVAPRKSATITRKRTKQAR